MTHTSERHFEKQAERILRYLHSPQRYDPDFLPRPFFIEFTGSPSSGKTTTITELDKFLRRHGFRVLCPQEGAEVIRHIPRTTPVYNIRTGLYALEQLIDLSYGHLYDVVILDRGIIDAYCWMMYWQGKDLLDDQETTEIQNFFLFREWLHLLDAAFIMTCNPDVAMEREQRIALSRKLGATTNPDTIRTLVDRYETAYGEIYERFRNVFLLDTSTLNEQKMVEVIASRILNLLEARAESRKTA